MATVPGTPDSDPIPRENRPTQADLYIAAAKVMRDQRLAGDVVQGKKYGAPWPYESRQSVPLDPASKGFEGADPNAVARGVMSGKVKVLRPEGDK